MTVLVRMTVNGEPATAAFAPNKTLLEVLREDLQLTGTKHGCELGECGACAVLIDGVPVLSCLTLGLACEGKSIRTIEGVAHGAELHPLQAAFADLTVGDDAMKRSGVQLDFRAAKRAAEEL